MVMLRVSVFAALTVLLTAASAVAQQAPASFFARWQARASAIQAQQPKWFVPVISPYPMLIQVFRTDVGRQTTPALVTNWNLGLSRGLNLIPFSRTEFDLAVPAFFEHGDANKGDDNGFGDMLATAKVRLLTGNEAHGDYMLTGFATATFPTASYKNGATNVTVTPGLSGGKGYGRLDAITTISGTLPTGNVATLGRSVATNSVLQYHLGKYLWPEVEVNTLAFYGSAKDGKVQSFVSPGLMLGRYAIHRANPTARSGLAAGVGFQVATTSYHLYNHALVLTGRYIF